jgi:hypothetical protein
MNKETLEEAAENNYYFESDIEMTNYISEMASTGRIPKRWSAFVAKINELYLFKQEHSTLNLDILKSKVDNALDNETQESLTEWLETQRNKQKPIT